MENQKAKGLAIQADQHRRKQHSQLDQGVVLELDGTMERVNLHHGYEASKIGKDVKQAIHLGGKK